jgi:CheY-like chemotaxis protein
LKQQRAEGAAIRTPMTLLVVDDEVSVRRVVRRALEPIGYTCHEAGTVGSALDLLAAHAVDLMIVDAGVLDRDGLRPLIAVRRAPVLVVSGAMRELGGDLPVRVEFLGKPFTLRALQSAVERLIAAV